MPEVVNVLDTDTDPIVGTSCKMDWISLEEERTSNGTVDTFLNISLTKPDIELLPLTIMEIDTFAPIPERLLLLCTTERRGMVPVPFGTAPAIELKETVHVNPSCGVAGLLVTSTPTTFGRPKIACFI